MEKRVSILSLLKQEDRIVSDLNYFTEHKEEQEDHIDWLKLCDNIPADILAREIAETETVRLDDEKNIVKLEKDLEDVHDQLREAIENL